MVSFAPQRAGGQGPARLTYALRKGASLLGGTATAAATPLEGGALLPQVRGGGGVSACTLRTCFKPSVVV